MFVNQHFSALKNRNFCDFHRNIQRTNPIKSHCLRLIIMQRRIDIKGLLLHNFFNNANMPFCAKTLKA